VSGIRTPNADGTFDGALPTIFKGSFVNPEGHGYAFELGQDDTAFSAYAGLLPSADPGPLPLQGIATMSGAYNVIEVGKSDGEIREFGEPQTTSGRISLRADFLFKTLQGSDGVLTIDGDFTGNSVSGSAFFNQRAASRALARQNIARPYRVAFTPPPSCKMFCPTMNAAWVEHKNAQVAPNSSAVP